MLSLRLSLSLLMLAGVILTVSFASILSGRDAEHEINELFDADMVQTAKLLELFYVNELTLDKIKLLSETPIRFHIPESNIDTLSEQMTAQTLSYERKLSFQLFSATGKLLAYSDNTDANELAQFTEGYVKQFINGHQWHVFRLYSEAKKVWIVTAQRNDVRQELVDEINANSWRSALIITPIMLLLLLMVTYYLFQPLSQLERHLTSRTAQDLSPIDIKLPKELISIQQALNSYLGRIASMMQRERRFSADAAHELKTPLAIIKLHSDGLTDLLTGADESIQQQALSYTQAVQKGIHRMGHTVEQLLLLSRVDAIDALNKTECSLQQLVDNVINQLVHIVADYEWQIDIPKGLTIHADRFYIEVVLKNIIENACKYSPRDSLITIRAEADELQCVICVIDQGNGMTSEQIKLAKNRFYRVDENVSQGAGLGLSICQNIMTLHQGDISFSQIKPTGLSVCLVLPYSA
ncbi:ATP-binding protein [Shewanella aestuarii]|uniref:histidine kinase n=1 Tax=Shewanella aestuarii TaxID=1028752 RepID=A0A6G9QIL8_9GAMM|nr:ATP-binding protein [Shewanella aestuarii]QIR13907.1 two-component sensor histidine kinase [Shewanella aestuarii]